MARKEKFNKEFLLDKGMLFIKNYGFEKLNARDLSKFIGCSTQPIFRVFLNMEDYKRELKNVLYEQYKDFIMRYVDVNNYLFTISYAYALFGKNEPNIFRALFGTELAGSRTTLEVVNTKRNKETINAMMSQYNISLNVAEKVYLDVRFYTHGIASQLCCGSIILSDNEIRDLILNMIDLCLKK